VFIDGKAFASHIPQAQFPAQSVCLALYRQGGIRAVELGSLAFAHPHPETGEWVYPDWELLRLTIPRRVYTQSHLDYVVDVVKKVWQQRSTLPGYKITYQTEFLRHFTARMAPAER
jgi:tryptophanase